MIVSWKFNWQSTVISVVMCHFYPVCKWWVLLHVSQLPTTVGYEKHVSMTSNEINLCFTRMYACRKPCVQSRAWRPFCWTDWDRHSVTDCNIWCLKKKAFMEIQYLAFFQSRTAERLSLIRADSHDRLHKLSPELLSNVDWAGCLRRAHSLPQMGGSFARL